MNSSTHKQNGIAKGGRGHVLENSRGKLVWDFEYYLRITTTYAKYQQLALEMRERRTGYKVIVVPTIIGCLGGEIQLTLKEVKRLFNSDQLTRKVVGTMQKRY